MQAGNEDSEHELERLAEPTAKLMPPAIRSAGTWIDCAKLRTAGALASIWSIDAVDSK